MDFKAFAGLQQIGSGSFKLVYRARLQQAHGSSADLAIQRIRGSGPTGRREEFEQEVRIFHQLGRHPNLLRLLGISIEPSSGDYCLVTEFASKGSLDVILSNLAEVEETMSLLVQLQVARQICDGMVQLSLHGVVHRDLATRNVLVFSLDTQDHLNVSVKIADYGLSIMAARGYGESRAASVSTAGSTARPLRWMAPESIKKRQYSEKSDVWAFGVTLWEIWTYGDVPFGTIVDDKLVGDQVLQGDRLPRPGACPDGSYQIMQQCWKTSKHERPTFADLQRLLQGQYDDALRLSVERHDEGKVSSFFFSVLILLPWCKDVLLFLQMVGNPKAQDVLEDHFDVSLNPESTAYRSCESETEDEAALAFANWMPEEESARQFNPNDVKVFLDQIDKGPCDAAKVEPFESFFRMMASTGHRLL